MANLKDKIQAKVKKAFGKVEPLSHDCTYMSMGTPTNVDGVVTENVIAQFPNINIIFSEFTVTRLQITAEYKDDMEVPKPDKVAMFEASKIPIAPSLEDIILDTVTNVRWRVKGLGSEPADAHYELHVRQIDG